MKRRATLAWISILLLVIIIGLSAGAAVRYPDVAIRLVAHVPAVGPAAQAWLADRFNAGRLVEHGHDALVDYWTCSMHTSVRHLEPGSCPICSMDLVPIYKPGAAPADVDTASGSAPAVSGTPTERATFQIDTTWQQAIGVTTEAVRRQSLRETLSTTGRVAYDENRLVDVNLRVSGWIETLLVAETGTLVHAGEHLFDLYSPELVSTQTEYLLARDNAAIFAGNASGGMRRRADSLFDVTRKRLERWGLSAGQIERLDTTGEVVDALPILSPATGYVVEKNAVQGMRVDPSMRLYQIADLSTVWVIADVYESELAFVREGMAATMTLAYDRRRRWQGHIDYIYPTVERATRTVQVRMVFANPDLELRPDMYGDVAFEATSGSVLAVPRAAVIDLGARHVLFVDLGAGRLQAREVQTGPEVNGMVPVHAGVAEGESVVTSGNFLVDAESKIRGIVPLPVDAEGMR